MVYVHSTSPHSVITSTAISDPDSKRGASCRLACAVLSIVAHYFRPGIASTTVLFSYAPRIVTLHTVPKPHHTKQAESISTRTKHASHIGSVLEEGDCHPCRCQCSCSQTISGHQEYRLVCRATKERLIPQGRHHIMLMSHWKVQSVWVYKHLLPTLCLSSTPKICSTHGPKQAMASV